MFNVKKESGHGLHIQEAGRFITELTEHVGKAHVVQTKKIGPAPGAFVDHATMRLYYTLFILGFLYLFSKLFF
jgi:hypothetical protein